MGKMFQSMLEWVAKNFSKDASKMLIITGVAGWTLSSLAQIFAISVNSKISNEQKSFLIPQELADAAVNIGSFFLITQFAKKTVSKLFSTGKFAPQKVREYLIKHKDLYADKIGKIDFSLDDIRKIDKNFPKKEYWATKNFYTALATVGAGIVSSNIVTPIVRNKMASKMQKSYLAKKQDDIGPKQTTFKASIKPVNYYSYGMKI